jgi:anaerobic ribonucleoside-triphosphate reductase
MNSISDLLPKVITSKGNVEVFNPDLIVKSIEKETGLKNGNSKEILKEVVRKIIAGNVRILTAPMIRELVCSVLIERGYEKERLYYTRLGIPFYDFKNLVNSNILESEKKEKVYEQIKKEYFDILKINKII